MSDQPEHRLTSERKAKLAQWRLKQSAYPNNFTPAADMGDLHAAYGDSDASTLKSVETSIAGRLMLKRAMGKAGFIVLQDESGRLQCYLKSGQLDKTLYEFFEKNIDLGDILGVSGHLMRTKTGELTLALTDLTLLAKSLHPLPDKHSGMTDTELKYRCRYLDLMTNENVRDRFRTRSKIIAVLRQFFVERGFLEVETPLMHPIPGGATARPFTTHHNSLDMDLCLRVAPELYLKRLVVGGFERVFELNRNFRNEGLSPRHNPEFTMLEWYQAYATYEDLMAQTEVLFEVLLKTLNKSFEVTYQGKPVNLKPPFPRLSLLEALCRWTGCSTAQLTDEKQLAALLMDADVAPRSDWGVGKMQMELFENKVEPLLIDPVFITQYPTEVSPLARRNDEDPSVTDRFELFIVGREIANGFSELNDPEDQRERFMRQAQAAKTGDVEAMHFDADYIKALEYGMPPVAGEGLGVDRLVMLLTDAASIRDVLLFPQLRPAD